MGGGHGHREVDPNAAEFKSVYGGRAYYFCSKQCKEKFDAEPGKYVK